MSLYTNQSGTWEAKNITDIGLDMNFDFEDDGNLPTTITNWTINSGSINSDMAVSDVAGAGSQQDPISGTYAYYSFWTNLDSGTSEIQSDNFTIPGAAVTFSALTQGGNDGNLGLHLILSNDTPIAKLARGDANTWEITQSDISSYAGMDAYLKIIDDETGAFDWVGIDNITFLDSSNNILQLATNNFNQTFSRIIDGPTLWTCEACDSDGDCGFAEENRTVLLNTNLPQITAISPIGILDYNFIGGDETLNATFIDSSLDTCWYNYNGTNITIDGCSSGINNATNFTLQEGNFNMTLYANDSIGNENSTFIEWSYKVLQNNNTFNSSAHETASESFELNLTVNTSLTAINLDYSGIDHSLTNQGSGIWSTTIDIPLNRVQNNTLKYEFTYAGDIIDSANFFQNVSETIFTICNSTYTTRFLNISFKDEGTLIVLNASIPTSTFEYYLGSGTVKKTFQYVNVSNNINYEFCATPNKVLNVDSFIQYKQGTLYPQRVFDPNVLQFSNEITNSTLYLLASSDGLFVTFQTVNSAEQIISGVLITAQREIESQDVFVGVGITAASGSVTLWLNPDFIHDFTFTKTGLPNITESFAPTQSSYTIIMGTSSQSQNSTIKGIDYSILPSNTFLENNTEYTFGFNLTSNFWDITEYGFNLRLADGTKITGDTSSTSGTQLTTNYNVNNQSIIYLDAFWLINSNYTNITRLWIVQNTEYSGYSIKTFFTDLSSYLDSGIFGLDNFGRNLIVFIIIFVSVGIMGQKFGIASPLGIISLIFGLVLFFDVVTGILPTIRGVENLPTFIAGLILVLAIFSEVQPG